MVVMRAIETYMRKCLFLLVLSVIGLSSCGDDLAEEIRKENNRFVPPVAGDGGGLTVSDIKADSFVLSWEPAKDERTPSGELRYRVYISTEDILSAYDLIEESASLKKVSEVTAGWTLSISTVTVSSLTSGTDYYCNVFVRDTDNCITPYTSTKVSLKTGEVPVPGNGGSLTAEWSTGYVKISWQLASDAETPQAKLLYKVFCTVPNPSDDCDSVHTYGKSEAVEKTVGWTESIDTLSAGNLSPESIYWFNVFVKDSHGNISAYEPVMYQTPANSAPVLSDQTIMLSSSASSQYLSWTKAADDYSSIVMYRVFASLDQTAVSNSSAVTVPVSNLDISGTSTAAVKTVYELTSGWTSDIDKVILPAAVTSNGSAITSDTKIYFAVFARDYQGLVSAYDIIPLSVSAGLWIR